MITLKPVLSVKNMVKIPKTHPKILDIIIDMLSRETMPYYGEFAQFITFKEAEQIETCAVSVTEHGMVFYWNRDFVEKLPKRELCFVIIHEIFHLLFDHPKRAVGYDPKISNLAMDMIINSIIVQDLMSNPRLTDSLDTPKDKFSNNMCVFMPDEYEGPWIFEPLYTWLRDELEQWKKDNPDKTAESVRQNTIDKLNDQYSNSSEGEGDENGSGSGNDEGEGEENQDDCDGGGSNESRTQHNNQKDSTGKPIYGKYGKNGQEMYSKEHLFENLEANKGTTLDQHILDEVTAEARENIVNDIRQNLKNRGLESGDVTQTLNKLKKKRKDYLKFIKRQLTSQIFGKKKNKTIFRPNRRGIWGLKGKRKYSIGLNVLLDVSGSMSGNFEKVLSYIFQNDIEMNLIQVDTAIQKVEKIYCMKDLEKLEIKGLGGTEITPGLQFIANDVKLNKLNNVILTDGYTDILDFSGIHGNTLIITTDEECKLKNVSKVVKQIVIEKED